MNIINDYIIKKLINDVDFLKLKSFEQHPEFHPEGDVYTHCTLCAEKMKSLTSDPVMIFSAYAHDLGKSKTKGFHKNRVTYFGHEKESADMIEKFLNNHWIDTNQSKKVVALVKYHMAPNHYKEAKVKSLKKLYNILCESKVDIGELLLLCMCDILASDNNFEDLDSFRERFFEANNIK
jgi:poly(A) polymerase